MKKQKYIAKKLREHEIETNISCSICKKCQGQCCKTSGCGLLPCDVEDMSVEGIKKMLDTGKYSISYIVQLEPVIPIASLTSREEGRGRIANSLIRSKCSLLKEDGCTLSEEERPTQALLLIPGENMNCTELITPRENIDEWLVHQQILEQVILDETGKTLDEIFEEGCAEDTKYLANKIENQEELTDLEKIVFKVLERKAYYELEQLLYRML